MDSWPLSSIQKAIESDYTVFLYNKRSCMSSHDWSRFVVRINVNAPIEKLYRAWATRSGMEFWFLRISEYKKPDGSLRGNDELSTKGDSYKWLWHGWPDEMVESGEILESNGKDAFQFSF